jgi:hypothetical protein
MAAVKAVINDKGELAIDMNEMIEQLPDESKRTPTRTTDSTGKRSPMAARKERTMSASKPVTKLDDHGVPHCTGARCPHHTPKQACAITGESVERVCAPAVRDMVGKLVQLRSARTAFSEASRG